MTGLEENIGGISYSMKDQCNKSPDTRHWWIFVRWGQQSNQHFKCKWCDETLVD